MGSRLNCIKLSVIIVLTILIWVVLPIILCLINNETEGIIIPDSERFLVLSNGTIKSTNFSEDYYIVVDNDTMVEYYCSAGKYNYGTLTPLYNSDGTIKLYEDRGSTSENR